MKRHLLFILALWIAIGVTLLNAVAPLGPPSSRLTGSAFNPATTGVVLKARSEAYPIAERTVEPDGSDGLPVFSSVAMWPLMAEILLLGVSLLSSANRYRALQPSSKLSRSLFRHRVRAPPLS